MSGFFIEQALSLSDIVTPSIDNVINDPTSQNIIGAVPLMNLLKILIYIGPPGIGGETGYFLGSRFDQSWALVHEKKIDKLIQF